MTLCNNKLLLYIEKINNRDNRYWRAGCSLIIAENNNHDIIVTPVNRPSLVQCMSMHMFVHILQYIV